MVHSLKDNLPLVFEQGLVALLMKYYILVEVKPLKFYLKPLHHPQTVFPHQVVCKVLQDESRLAGYLLANI